MTKLSYKYYNANPYNWDTDDCIIRALTVFLNKPYEEIIADLTIIYIKTGLHICDSRCLKKYITNLPNVKCVYKNIFTINNKVINKTLDEIYEDLSNNKHTLLIIYNNHVSVIKNDIMYDTDNYLIRTQAKINEVWELTRSGDVKDVKNTI